MNKVNQDPLFRPLALPGADPARELNPTFQQTMSAAFGLENDVVNLLDFMSRPTFAPDPTFKFQDEFKARGLPLEWMPMLAPAQSVQEFDVILGRVQKEYQQRAVLAASGWAGTVAAVSAGILSPTVFIPLVGQARGGLAVAQMLGLAAAAATAHNAALYLNQETRTEAMLYTGIAMDTLLMGMMGGAYLGLREARRARLARDITFNERRVIVPEGPPDMPPVSERIVRSDTPSASEVKRVAQEEGIRNPDDVQDLIDEAGGGPVRLRDKALQIRPIARVQAKSFEEQLANGKSFLEAEIADGVTARFTKMPVGGGGKWFVGGEYAITLRAADGTEINIPAAKADTHQRNGNTGIYKEAELRQAIAEGRLDDQFYDMLEVANDPRVVNDPRMAMADSVTPIRTSSPDDALAVGAAPSRKRNTLGSKAAPNAVRQAMLNTLGKLSPAFSMQNQRASPALRDAAYKLDTAGIQQAGLDRMEPSADGGTVIERIRGYDPGINTFAKELDKNFYEYTYGIKLEDENLQSFRVAAAQVRSNFGTPMPGKMSWDEYKEAISYALNTGQVAPEIANSVKALKDYFEVYTKRQEQYLDEFAQKGIEVEPLFKKLKSDELGEGLSGYSHHIVDQNKLMDNFSEFLQDFSTNFEKSLSGSFTRSQAAYNKKKAALAFESDISRMTPEELKIRLTDTESDLELLDELSELQALREERLALNQQAREEGWSKEALAAQQKDLRESQSEAVNGLLAERKQLMSTARMLRKFGGDAEVEIAKLKSVISSADNLISSMFRNTVPKILKVDLSIGKIQRQGDAALKPVVDGIEKIVKALAARQAKMAELLQSSRGNTTSRQKVAEQIEAQKLKYDGMMVRLEVVKGQQVALDVRLSELHLLREDAVRDANRLVRSRSSKLDDLEDKLEELEAKPLTPADRSRMGDQIGREISDLERSFSLKWSGRGEYSGDPANTLVPNFKEKSIEMATMLHQKLTKSEIGLSPAYKALRQDARGPELLRVWNVPWAIKSKWLVHDVELITRAYDRAMAPDLEIWRAFDGSVNGASLLGKMQEELTSKLIWIETSSFVKLPKGWVDKSLAFSERVKKRLNLPDEAESIFLEPKNFSDQAGPGFVPLTPELRNQLGIAVRDIVKAGTYDFDVAIQRLRVTRGAAADTESTWYRTGKVIKDLNVLTMMGGVVTASVSDVARPIWQHGVARTFKHGWAPFINKLNPQAKEFRVRSKEINQQIGLNLEPMLHSRAQAMFGLAESTIGRTRVERGISIGASKMGIIALYSYWTAGMKTIAGNVTHATMAAYIPEVAKAWRANPSAAMTGDLLEMQIYLRNLGLRDLDIHRIALQMERPDGIEYFSNGGVLPNVDKWDDMAAYQAYQAAVLGEVNKLIVTPGLERPNIVDQNMGYSMVFQFKSFVFAANSRMAMSALQGNDPYLMQGVAFSLAFGALSYYTYALTVGGRTLEIANERDPEKWVWESVKRSGILGALSIGADAGARIPLISGDDRPLIIQKPSGLLGVLLGPTYSQVEKMAEVVMKIDTDDPEQQERNMRALRQIYIPYQNHFLFRQLFDRAGEAMFGS